MHISRMVLKLALAATVGLIATTASASIPSDCQKRSEIGRYGASVEAKKNSTKKFAQSIPSKKPAPTKARKGKS